MFAKYRFRLILLVMLVLMSGLAALDAQAQTPQVCPLTQGYWANHPENWAANSLMLGTQFYTQAELLALMPGGGGDASTILAVQMIATKLNIAAGADPASISAALLTADSLLGQFTGKLPYNVAPSSSEGQAMINIAGLLDSFNNGDLTPGCALTATATFTATATPTHTPTYTATTPPPTATFTPTPTNTSAPVTCEAGVLVHNFRVAYVGRVYDPATNQTTFTYLVCGTGTPPDLSHFDIEIPVCIPALNVVATNPTDAVSFGTDPTTGINGIKWDSPLLTTATRTYSITFAGDVAEGSVQVAVKGGDGFTAASLPGASCDVTSTPPVTIIVEGPVQAINANIITIFDIDIEVNVNDPILTVIQVGDVVHVEGDTVIGGNTVIIVAVTVVIVNVDVDVVNVDVPAGGNPPPQEGGNVVICHHAQGESGHRETITVEWSAWVNAHSGHRGDHLGHC